jgi:hypothetical protein
MQSVGLYFSNWVCKQYHARPKAAHIKTLKVNIVNYADIVDLEAELIESEEYSIE